MKKCILIFQIFARDRISEEKKNNTAKLPCHVCFLVGQRIQDDFHEIKSLKAIEIWFYKGLLNIPLSERVSNGDVLTKLATRMSYTLSKKKDYLYL